MTELPTWMVAIAVVAVWAALGYLAVACIVRLLIWLEDEL